MKRKYPDAPVVSVGAIVVREGRVLLAQRGHPPGEGMWAFPGGVVDLGETLAEAAEREIREECGIRVRVLRPFAVVDRILRDEVGRVEYHYVIVDMLAEWVEGELQASSDARQVGWFAAEELESLPLTRGVLELARRALAERVKSNDNVTERRLTAK
ncbi:MAG: NUDIX hydrolase [Anaerolineae bacterium]|nr:NUDIX hydrolase [Anaerolineae bacterium]